ncbi:MAG: ATP-binding protein [Motilibacteraceae bacterium]
MAWGFGAGATAAMSAGAGLPRLRHAAGGGGALVVAYLVVSLPAASHIGVAWTAVTNSVALIGFAAGTWVVARFIRELAAAADVARAGAAELARRAALDRQRLLLHDQATVLSLLSRPGLDQATESALRQQAARASRRVRAFLAQEGATAGLEVAGGAPLPLTGLLAAVVEEFGDLPLTVNIDLAGGVCLSGAASQTLAAAVRTLLHNVRQHARATAVTLHADTRPDGAWEVSVQDDGVGFDPEAVSGFGLRVQAGSALRESSMSVAVDSAPGEGAKVTIIGPVAEDEP